MCLLTELAFRQKCYISATKVTFKKRERERMRNKINAVSVVSPSPVFCLRLFCHQTHICSCSMLQNEFSSMNVCVLLFIRRLLEILSSLTRVPRESILTSDSTRYYTRADASPKNTSKHIAVLHNKLLATRLPVHFSNISSPAYFFLSKFECVLLDGD